MEIHRIKMEDVSKGKYIIGLILDYLDAHKLCHYIQGQ